MLNSKKLISLSLAFALVLSLPLNSLAIGVNDASNYVTSSDYNAKITELETRIADLEANQSSPDVNTALQNYFNDESTSPIVAGDYITIKDNNGKKMISASSKPTTISAGDQHIEVTKTETDSDITFTLKNKSTSYTSNFDTSASSQGVLNAARRVVPDSVSEAWVSGSGKFDLAMLKNNGPLYSGATGTLTGSYKVHFTKTFVSAEIYDTNGLYAVAYSPTTDFRSLNNLNFNGVRVTNSTDGIPYSKTTVSLTPVTGFSGSGSATIYKMGHLCILHVDMNFRVTAAATPDKNGQIKIANQSKPLEVIRMVGVITSSPYAYCTVDLNNNSVYVYLGSTTTLAAGRNIIAGTSHCYMQ